MTARDKIDAYREVDQILFHDLEAYCRAMVKIKDKNSGDLIPFTFKRAQRHVHDLLEEQRRRTGKVRALILKYRQGGISTYMGGRFYHRTSLNQGKKTYILTHEDSATRNLFAMAKRIHEQMAIDYKPRDTADNANELWFGDLDSGYQVGTARNVHGGGRSQTIHFFHGSECAFWAQADTHYSGVLQAVPSAPGTEIVMETTANGPNGVFYEQWQLAMRGESEFIPIFLPWFWEDDYQTAVPPGFEPSTEEMEYATLYDLTAEQIVWAHFKNIELGGEPGKFCYLFKQEYPANAAEAFQTSGTNSYISTKHILEARRRIIEPPDYLPIVIGVDCAYGGADKTRMLDRQGRRAGAFVNKVMDVADTTIIGDAVVKEIKRVKARMAFIDVGGVGAGVYDYCRRLGYEEYVSPINFGSSPSEVDRYYNKRAEMYGRIQEWISDPAGVQIPDDDLLHAHLSAITAHVDANSRLKIDPKDKIRKDCGFSPDYADALALTFAAEVFEPVLRDDRPEWARKLRTGSNRSFMSR